MVDQILNQEKEKSDFSRQRCMGWVRVGFGSEVVVVVVVFSKK